jgi:hypothetical protein
MKHDSIIFQYLLTNFLLILVTLQHRETAEFAKLFMSHVKQVILHRNFSTL